MTDPIAINRHHDFGTATATDHFRKYPAAKFRVPDLLELMRTAMRDTAADHGIGRRALEPYARAAAAAFLRRWRQLSRASVAPPDTDGWRDWPTTIN